MQSVSGRQLGQGQRNSGYTVDLPLVSTATKPTNKNCKLYCCTMCPLLMSCSRDFPGLHMLMYTVDSIMLMLCLIDCNLGSHLFSLSSGLLRHFPRPGNRVPCRRHCSKLLGLKKILDDFLPLQNFLLPFRPLAHYPFVGRCHYNSQRFLPSGMRVKEQVTALA